MAEHEESAAAEPTAAPPPPPPVPGAATGVVGTPRPIGMSILLFIVTLGIWGLYYVFKTHEEIKQYSGQGVGGGVGLIIAVLVGIVTPFLLASEVKTLHEQDGRESPVTGATGAWILLPLVGGFIWFVKVQRALNEFWVSKGAPAV
jgi:uncharacterized protein DUF4234